MLVPLVNSAMTTTGQLHVRTLFESFWTVIMISTSLSLAVVTAVQVHRDAKAVAGQHDQPPFCAGPASCSLSGVCSSDGSSCVCDPGFRGPRCASLALTGAMHSVISNLPVGINSTTVSTVWGGHALAEPVDGSLHWYGSAIRGNHNLASWATASAVGHARLDCPSTPCPPLAAATFSLDSLAVVPDGGSDWSGGSMHGVYVVRNPAPWANGTDAWLIYFTGFTVANPLGSRQIGVAHASTLAGPWTVWPTPVLSPNTNRSAVDTSSVSNPAPFFDRDGSGRVLLAYKGLGVAQPSRPVCTDGSGRPCIFVAEAKHWTGPYTHVTANSGAAVMEGEDPTLWQDSREGWHMIKEHYINGGLGGVGGHCFSTNGLSGWECADPSTWYTTQVVLNGKPVVLEKRERPQIVFDTDGHPVALYNGACKGGSCFNVVMPFNSTR